MPSTWKFRISEPGDLELASEVIQVNLLDRALTGIAERHHLGVDLASRARVYRSAEEDRLAKGRASLQGRHRELPGHVVVEHQAALDVRHRHVARHAPKVEAVRHAHEVIRVGGIDADAAR